ncbi:condensin complex subunit 1-like [Pollicipes pollicipes]|uniref:condensin complex subunit 1-like n=1 Tax=Pollicipes pollicipes TaxID=41117 RepID=UPI00188502DE|nr:condensin complex subunit 1-like [Pollicipes pollicipes]
MSHFEFIIPIQRDELQQPREAGSYVVRHVYEPSELQSSVHDLVVALSTDRSELALEKFDVLYSSIIHFSSLKTADQEQIWEIVNKGYVYLTADLSALLESESLDHETRLKHLNMLKMSTYVLCQLAGAFEDAAQRPADVLMANKGRKRGGRPAADEGDWDAQRLRVLRQLYAVLQLRLRTLWQPPVPDEEFVNTIGNVCYHFLALPSVGHVRNKTLLESISQVLGALVRSYGHALSCGLKMVQILQQYEHAPAPLAQCVVTIATEFGGRGLVNELVREIAGTDAAELTKDGSATRHYAEFLSLVAVQAPDLVLNNICLLIGHLDGESHLMTGAADLGDKSSNVRRAALQLVTALLQANPFAAKLPVAELEEQYRTEKAKLAELGVDEEEEEGKEEEKEEEEEEGASDDSGGGDASPLLAGRERLLALLSADGGLAEAARLLLAEPRLLPGLAPDTDDTEDTADRPDIEDR